MTPTFGSSPDQLERLGRYRIVRPLSKGGMALVYEARRESLAGVSPRVAIKLILPDYAASDAFQELFINEARLGAAMQHQNLVGIQDFDRDGDKFFLVMEYVEGLTLRRLVTLCVKNNLRFPLSVVAELGRQACDGLHHAHNANSEDGTPLHLVHRDVKPSNLILNPQGVVKVLDFGISKGRLTVERKGSVKGTWGYMAPEQALGEEVGPPSDVFGLATVLWELAALRPMFEQHSNDEIKRLLLDDHAIRMSTQLDAAYEPLIPVLMRALQRDANQRYASAADFGRALSGLVPEPVTAREEVLAFYNHLDALSQGKPAPGRPDNTESSIAEPTPPSSTLPLVIAGLMVVAALVVGAVAAIVIATGAAANVIDEIGAAVAPPPASNATADEPPGPNGVGAPGESRDPPPRRPPETSLTAPGGPHAASPTVRPNAARPAEVTPEPEPEAHIVVSRRPEPPPVAEAPAPTAAIVHAGPSAEANESAAPIAGVGRLTVSATPGGFSVFLDGKLLNKGPVSRQEVPAGRHWVMIIADGGAKKEFGVDVKPENDIRKIWDFDRNEFRR
jgi:serine/threonine protein kinase